MAENCFSFPFIYLNFVSMNKLFLLILVFIHPCAEAQDINALDNENSFRGHRFGDSITLYPAMIKFDQTPDSLYAFYRKTDENFTFGGAGVDIVYTFYKGCLSNIFMQTHDSLGSRKVLKTLQDLYGKGQQQDPYVEKHMWWGREVILSYFEDVNKFDAKIYISSIKMKLRSEGRDKY